MLTNFKSQPDDTNEAKPCVRYPTMRNCSTTTLQQSRGDEGLDLISLGAKPVEGDGNHGYEEENLTTVAN